MRPNYDAMSTTELEGRYIRFLLDVGTAWAELERQGEVNAAEVAERTGQNNHILGESGRYGRERRLWSSTCTN
jgi:hypothetical protein